MPKKTKNAFYAQSGGVTAVINVSAAAVIETARAHPDQIGKVLAGKNGILGALREQLYDTSLESVQAIHGLRHTPGGAFGSCRYKLKSLETHRAEYERHPDDRHRRRMVPRVDQRRAELSVSLYGEVQKEVLQATLAEDYGLEGNAPGYLAGIWVDAIDTGPAGPAPAQARRCWSS